MTFVQEEEAWTPCYHQAPLYAHVTLRTDPPSYALFDSPFPLSNDPTVPYQPPSNAVMFTDEKSDVDIITPETFKDMGYSITGLMEVSDEGYDLFRQANMRLLGALFARIGVINPATRRGHYTKSLVYVAQTRLNRNYMSSMTVNNLRLRGTIGADLHTLLLPQNALKKFSPNHRKEKIIKQPPVFYFPLIF